MSDDDKKPKKKPGPKPPPPLEIETDEPLQAFDKPLGTDPEKPKAVALGRACLSDGCDCKGYDPKSEWGVAVALCQCGHALAAHPQAEEE